ncbi:MAG: DUF4190 domain-containing protein [Actinobacteria bacterium]|nr:DUF4190 domain-containing protein [Actinomycetota bacterium]
MKTCPRCGAQNDDSAAFCGQCGAAFEQAGAFAQPAPPGPAQPGPAQPVQPAPPPPYGYQAASAPPYGAPYQPAPYPPYHQESNSKATASLVLGIVGLFVCPLICSAIALILGSQAKKEIAASGGMMSGESSATAGIILGWVGIGLSLIGIIIWAVVMAVVASHSTLLPVILSAL